MHIFDPIEKRRLSEVTLFLTPEQAAELASTAEDLARDPGKHHGHVSNADYTVEITVAVYRPSNLEGFDEESRRLLAGDEF